MTPDEWNHILNTNLTSVFNCCRLAIPMMVSRKSGHILNISSVWGICGASCEVAYSATKGGINAMTREGTCAEQHPGQRDRLRRY